MRLIVAVLAFMVAGCDGPFDPNFLSEIGQGCDKQSMVIGRIGTSALVNFYQTTRITTQVRDAAGTLRDQMTLGCLSGGCVINNIPSGTSDTTLIQQCGQEVASR